MTEYTRGYNKGRSTGERKADEKLAAAKSMADQAAQRAERAEKQQGLGHCEDCANWRQGARPTPGWEQCLWGTCEMPRASGSPWGTWAGLDGSLRYTKLQTTPRFGCVVFMAAKQGEKT